MGEYQIQLNKDTIPYALATLRHVLLPLMGQSRKSNKELKAMVLQRFLGTYVQSIK